MSRRIGLGCLSCAPGKVDAVETIVARASRACEVLFPERVTLDPECGFAAGSAAVVDMGEVYEELRNEADTARRWREKFA